MSLQLYPPRNGVRIQGNSFRITHFRSKFIFKLKINFQAHVTYCPDKASVDRFLYSVDAGGSSSFKTKEETFPRFVNDDEENWDNVSYCFVPWLVLKLYVIIFLFYRMIVRLMIRPNMSRDPLFCEQRQSLVCYQLTVKNSVWLKIFGWTISIKRLLFYLRIIFQRILISSVFFLNRMFIFVVFINIQTYTFFYVNSRMKSFFC